MIKPKNRIGDIPSNKEAYGNSLKIAAPAVVEMVGMALMALVDMMMVGRIGAHAVAAIGLTNQPRMIFFSFFFALNIAVTAIVARSKGAGDLDGARSCLRQALSVGVIVGLILTVLAVIFARPMMQFSGAQYDTIEPATDFFRISGYGIMFAVLSQIICAAQRAVGNTKITMQVNLVANIVKVLFNFLLIGGYLGFPALGVSGAGVSMVIANVVSFVLAGASLLQKDSILGFASKDRWKPEIIMLKRLWQITSGALVEQVGLRIGFFAFALVIAGLGTNDFAAHQIGMQVMNITFTFADGIAIAATALVGQSLGMKRLDLSVMYGKIGLRLALGISAILCLGVFLTRNHFPMLITSDELIVQTASGLLVIMIFILPILMSQVVLGGTLRGAGDTKFVAITMIISVGVLRPLCGFIFTYTIGLGLAGAWIAIIVDQSARLLMLFVRFTRGKWLLT